MTKINTCHETPVGRFCVCKVQGEGFTIVSASISGAYRQTIKTPEVFQEKIFIKICFINRFFSLFTQRRTANLFSLWIFFGIYTLS